MNPFRSHTGRVVPLLRRDIDTDQIIPKQFLKRLDRTGFGQNLFHDWRRRPDGSLDPAFPLNEPRYAGASILVAGANFGCGSSREHAAWALTDSGFRAVVAPSFADIFCANAVANGLLPVSAPAGVVTHVAHEADRDQHYELAIDLEACRLRDATGLDEPFDIDAAARRRLLEGLDDIGIILQHEEAIAAFETRRR